MGVVEGRNTFRKICNSVNHDWESSIYTENGAGWGIRPAETVLNEQ